MKKIYYFLTKCALCCLFLLAGVGNVSAQCPAPAGCDASTFLAEYTVTYTAGGFDQENAWSLYDATASNEVLCWASGQNLAFGTTVVQSACVPIGNDVEIYIFESFGDGWCAGGFLEVAMAVDVDAIETACPGACASPSVAVNGATPMSAVCPATVLPQVNPGGTTNSTYNCTGNPTAGILLAAIETSCGSCALVCPADVTVTTAPGVCTSAPVDVSDLGISPAGCVIAPGTVSVAGLNNDVAGVGCTLVTINAVTGSGTGSGQFAGLPLSCSYQVSVFDEEAPVFDCPQSFTFNLQGGQCCQIYDFEVSVTDNCPGAPETFTGACGAPETSFTSLACAGGTNSIIQILPAVPAGSTLTEVCFSQRNFGAMPTDFTINAYCYDGVTIPYTGGPVAPFGTLTVPYDDNNDVSIVCVDLSVIGAVAPGCTGIAIEIFTTNGRVVATPNTCAGGAATGNNTYFVGPSCGVTIPTLLSDTGSALDAAFQATFALPVVATAVVPPAGTFPATATVNAFETGSELPIGTHCFFYESTDGADDILGCGTMDCDGGTPGAAGTANTSTCSWCITVNGIPEDQISTALACNTHVNVSVDENCSVDVNASMFLSGTNGFTCFYDCYEVYIKDENGTMMMGCGDDAIKSANTNVNDLNGCSAALPCGEYVVEIFDACREVTCWGTMTVEDKLAPTISVPEDVTLSCVASTAPGCELSGVVNVALPANSMQWNDGSGGVVGTQTITIPAASPGSVITDVNLDMQLSHSWMGDIDITLTGPNGSTIFLLDGNCTLNDNVNSVFDEENGGSPNTCQGNSIGNTDAEDCVSRWMISATHSPVITTEDFANGGLGLTQFNGLPLGGDWTLTINSINNGDGGCLEAFAMEIFWAKPAVIAPTLVAAGCDDELTFSDRVVNNDCDGTFIFRTWTATDAKGNSSSQTQTITVEPIGADGVGTNWFWPIRTVELTCGADASPDAIYDFYLGLATDLFPCLPSICTPDDDGNFSPAYHELIANRIAYATQRAYPFFLNTYDFNNDNCGDLDLAVDFRDNACQMKFTLSDNVIPACGPGCNGNTKTIRTWTALDWCSATTLTHEQIIKSTDETAPVVDMSPEAGVQSSITMVAGAQPWGCNANFTLPAPEHLTDNCSTDITYEVSGPAPTAYVNGEWKVTGAPVGTHTFTYEAFDCCGNVGTGSVVVTVADGSAPIAIATQDIVVNLAGGVGIDGTAKIFASSVDNGSHDGDCGDVRVVIRRTEEDATCGNIGNSSFENLDVPFGANIPNSVQEPGNNLKEDTDGGQFVKFCCEDVAVGSITVELGVWDDADGDGRPGSSTDDNFSTTWATIKLEAKESPSIACPPNAMIECSADENSDNTIETVLGRATSSATCGTLSTEYTDVCGWDQDGDDSLDGTFTMMGQTGSETFNKACHYGPIVRTWSVIGGNNSCTQIIIIKKPTTIFYGGRYLPGGNDDNPAVEYPFERDGVDTDGDRIDEYSEVILECAGEDLQGEPTWVNEHCSLIAYTLSSDTLRFEGDACLKIINTYSVIDWCNYNPNDPDAGGRWSWTVIGKLIDTTVPVLTVADVEIPVTGGSGGSGSFPTTQGCSASGIEISATALDGDMSADGTPACPSSWISWTVLLDINNDWSYDREWSSFVVEDSPVPFSADTNGNGIVDVQVGNGFDNADGTKTAPGDVFTILIPDAILADCGETQHKVEWTAFDGCGNKTSATSYFTVKDIKAPTPFCVNLSTAIMDVPPTGGEAFVELWANDFDAGSFDNCTAEGDLAFTFVDDASTVNPEFNSASMKFTCADLAGGNPALLTIPVYVWDGCGNRDFCLANLRLVDNVGACPTGPTTGSIIAGNVSTENGEMVEDVEVINSNMSTVAQLTEMTNVSGDYDFYNNERGTDHELTGSRDGDDLNGISTADLIYIQRHILGAELLDSPYKRIAADVNNDGRINGQDLIELRKLVLGVYNEFPQNTSWRFVDADQTLDINNPWNFNESIMVENLSADMMTEDFIGVKIGDVNNSVDVKAAYTTSNPNTAKSINLNFSDRQVEAGETVEVTVTSNDINNVFGYQFTLATPGLQLMSVKAGNANVSDANFGVFGDVLTTSWNTVEGVDAGDLFTMTFKSTNSGMLSEILSVNSSITSAEAYVGSNLEVVNISINNSASDVDYALMQNEPNPFSNATVIGYEMAKEAIATFTVYDVTGKVLTTKVVNATKGYNTIELSKSELGASGVLYYQFDSGDFTATKKMIIIE